MFRSFLAGAGLAALVDAWLMLPLEPSAQLPREYLLLTVGGTLGAAVLTWVALRAVLVLPPLRGLERKVLDRGAFGPGLVLGAMPMVMVLLEEVLPRETTTAIMLLPSVIGVSLWLIPVGVALLLPPVWPRWSGRVLGSLALIAPLAVGVAWLLPSSVTAAPAEPEAYGASARAESLPPRGTPVEGRPDLVLVSIDTLRTDLRRAERPILATLEELRAEGLWSAAGYSTSNQTVPGHLGMLSGLEPDQHLVGQNVDQTVLPVRNAEQNEGVAFLAQLLRERAGYRTAGVVSNAMAAPFFPGYEVWDDTRALYGRRFFFMRSAGRATWLARIINTRRAQDLLAWWLHVEDSDLLPPGMSEHATDQALRYHAAMVAAGGAPLHLFVHYMDPHSPYTPPDSTRGSLSAGQELPPGFQEWTDNHRILINRVRQGLNSDKPAVVEASRQAAALMHTWYDEELLALDADLSRLVAGLRASGRPTLLLVTSDHGEHFGEHGLMEHSNSLFQELVQVPFVLVGLNGAVVPQAELPGPPSVIDVVPTFWNAAGVSFQTGGEAGRAGVDLLDAEARAGLDGRILTMAWSSGQGGHLAGAVQGARKLLVRVEPGAELDQPPVVTPVAAYNLEADPGEARSLHAELPAAFAGLEERLALFAANWASVGYFDPAKRKAANAELTSLLDSLGYVVQESGPP